MTIKTSDAARNLGVHPFDLVGFACRMTGSLGDLWPEIDEALVETLGQMGLGARETRPAAEGGDVPDVARPPARTLGVSEAAARVLDKLERRNHWGSNHVNLDTVRNHFCRGVPGLDEGLEELLDRGLLSSAGGRKGPVSLDTHAKGEIDTILSRFRAEQGQQSH